MRRVAIIGNSGGGKSTLARRLATARRTPHVEIDGLLWREGWELAPQAEYEARHAAILASSDWIMDGLGRRESIPARLTRATQIILVDMPLWMHFWLAAERQIAWSEVGSEHAPGGVSERPPTRGLFQTIWEVDSIWMPELRALCAEAEARGTPVVRLGDVDALDAYARTL